jgi:MinD superfamily P-loop ATPase
LRGAQRRSNLDQIALWPSRLLRFARNDGLLAMKLTIDYAICNSCGLCREVCAESAIRPKLLEPRHLYEIMPEKCTGCGECLDYCPAPGALVQLPV